MLTRISRDVIGKRLWYLGPLQSLLLKDVQRRMQVQHPELTGFSRTEKLPCRIQAFHMNDMNHALIEPHVVSEELGESAKLAQMRDGGMYCSKQLSHAALSLKTA